MWHLMPSRPSSKTWNSPAGPAPMISASVSIGVAVLAGVGSVKAGTSGKSLGILPDSMRPRPAGTPATSVFTEGPAEYSA